MKIVDVLIHATNFAWAIRVFFVLSNNPNPSLNLFHDLPFIVLVSICVLLQSIRWAKAPQILSTQVEGRGEIYRLRAMANYMYGATPYFGRFIPQDEVLIEGAYADESEKKRNRCKNITSVRHILRIRKLVIAHFFGVCLCLFFMANAGLPSFAGFLSQVWVALPILVCLGTAMLIYSMTTVLFFLIFKGMGKL